VKVRLVTLGVLAVLFIAALVLGGFYVDWLWYASLGLESVLTSVLILKVVLFLVAAVLFFVVWTASALVAGRLSRPNGR